MTFQLSRRNFGLLAGAAIADSKALVIGAHFAAPTAGRVEREGEAFRFVV